MCRLVVALVFSLALVLSGLVGVAPSGPLRSVEAASGVVVKVQCDGNPEATRVTNNRSGAVKIKNVGSIYKPRSNEPFRVDLRLAPGKTVAFETGYDANSNTLTRQYIYNSDVGSKEGSRVATSEGAFADRC